MRYAIELRVEPRDALRSARALDENGWILVPANPRPEDEPDVVPGRVTSIELRAAARTEADSAEDARLVVFDDGDVLRSKGASNLLDIAPLFFWLAIACGVWALVATTSWRREPATLRGSARRPDSGV